MPFERGRQPLQCIHLCRFGSAIPQPVPKLLQGFPIATGNAFDTSITTIAHPAAQTQGFRLDTCCLAEADPLNAPGDQEAV